MGEEGREEVGEVVVDRDCLSLWKGLSMSMVSSWLSTIFFSVTQYVLRSPLPCNGRRSNDTHLTTNKTAAKYLDLYLSSALNDKVGTLQ